VSQKCLQSGLWLSRLRCCCWSRSLPTVGGRAGPSGARFLRTGPSPTCRRFPPAAAGLSPSAVQIGEWALLALAWSCGPMALSSPLGDGGAGVHAVCGGCSSSSLSCSAGPVSSSFSAESSVLVHGLEGCRSHLESCHFLSAFFLADSRSAFALLSSAPAFLRIPLGCLGSFRLPLFPCGSGLPVAPGRAGLPGNERWTRLPDPGRRSLLPVFLPPWLGLLQRLDTLATLRGTGTFSQLPLLPDSFGFLGGAGPSPSYPL